MSRDGREQEDREVEQKARLRAGVTACDDDISWRGQGYVCRSATAKCRVGLA